VKTLEGAENGSSPAAVNFIHFTFAHDQTQDSVIQPTPSLVLKRSRWYTEGVKIYAQSVMFFQYGTNEAHIMKDILRVFTKKLSPTIYDYQVVPWSAEYGIGTFALGQPTLIH